MADDGSVARYRTNLQGEVDSAALYRAMAEAEKDPHLRGLPPPVRCRGGPRRILGQAAGPDRCHGEGTEPGLADPRAGLARPALWSAIRSADLEQAGTARYRAIRTAAGSRRRRVA